MRILALMVTKDEADRYLDCALTWLAGFVDDIFVYDDRSEDDTVGLAARRGANVFVRAPDVPSFLQHEGRFRQSAWQSLEDRLVPMPDDWILAVDADEFLVTAGDERHTLEQMVKRVESDERSGVVVPIPEVFEVAEEDGLLIRPQVRIDGHWGRISGARFFPYRPGGLYANRRMGCGSAPGYVRPELLAVPPAGSIDLLHYGYARAEDRAAKYQRYADLADHGHAPAHVQSILAPGQLRPHPGPYPRVWLGERFRS